MLCKTAEQKYYSRATVYENCKFENTTHFQKCFSITQLSFSTITWKTWTKPQIYRREDCFICNPPLRTLRTASAPLIQIVFATKKTDLFISTLLTWHCAEVEIVSYDLLELMIHWTFLEPQIEVVTKVLINNASCQGKDKWKHDLKIYWLDEMQWITCKVSVAHFPSCFCHNGWQKHKELFG